jgi:hypothetical protein
MRKVSGFISVTGERENVTEVETLWINEFGI